MSNNKQMSREKEFVPYEEALVLKELGFDEPCFGCFSHLDNSEIWTSRIYINGLTENVAAPTFSQAFRWFRDKDLNGEVYSQQRPKGNFMYAFRISGTDIIEDGFTSYEEAELACLKKLIEIVKEQNNEP